MAFDTYAGLQGEIAEWLNRDDLAAKIPSFIALAEEQFNSRVSHPSRETMAALSASAETVALPSDCWAIRSLCLDSAPRLEMRQMSLGDLRDRYTASGTGRPVDYAVQGGNIVLGPIPNGTYSLKLTYQQTIPALSVSNPSNWLLARHPRAYLYGAMLHAEAYLVNDERLGVWKAALDEVLDEIRKSGIQKRHGAAPMQPRSLIARIRNIRA